MPNPFKPTAMGRLVWAAIMVVAVQSAFAADTPAPASPETAPLIQAMEGKWAVSEQMWPGPGKPPVPLPPAIADRRLIRQSFLQEVMEPAQAGEKAAFTRIAYFEFNATERRFEYFSLDSRMPQMMNERGGALASPPRDPQALRLEGGHFVAPTWGDAHDVPFHYRLAIGAITADRQTIQLFLQPESGADRREFLAFEYQYARVR